MIREREMDEGFFRRISDIVPGKDPVVVPRPINGGPERIISVADVRLDGNELKYLTECVESNWISSGGEFVRRFESEFARAAGCRYAVACSSGTVSLHLVLAALGIGSGDEVIIPSFTMIATANAITYTGAKPTLVDSSSDDWNLDPSKLAEKITPRTRAIIPVHTYGRPVDMDSILQVGREHNLYVIEDAAEAHGASYKGRPTGSLGDAACFSFYANKIVTTGEGGMITTNDERIAALARQLRDHAFSHERHFWHKYLGFNYRMTNLQAAVGLAQTERLQSLVEKRRTTARLYSELLSSASGLLLPSETADSRSVFWMYGLLVEDEFGCSRDDLRRILAEAGIETRTFFIPIHLQPVYYESFIGQRFPVAEELCKRGLYLPSGPGLTESDIAYIAEKVLSCVRK